MTKTLTMGALLCLALLPTSALSQIKAGSEWTDGVASYIVEKNGGHLAFKGSTCYEGGYVFDLMPLSNGRFKIIDSEGYDYTTFGRQAKIGDIVSIEQVEGVPLLVGYNAHNEVIGVIQPLEGDLYTLVEHDMHDLLAGDYISDKGKRWTFSLERTVFMPGMKAACAYTIEKAYDTPSNVITVNGKSYWLELSTTGINIYNVVSTMPDALPEGLDKGSLIARLRRVESPFGTGRWAFTSRRLVNAGMMSMYDKNMLRIIRNEIFARYGLRFKNDDLKRYFSAQAWYHPTCDAVNEITLTPIEQMNVKIIRCLENACNLYNTHTEEGY